MTQECDFCGLRLDSDEPLCPRCGHVSLLKGDAITSDRTTSYRRIEPHQEIETSLEPRQGLITRIADAIKSRKRVPVPEPGRTSRKIPPGLRFAVLRRDDFHCRYCGRAPPTIVLEVDHAKSWRQGGETTLANLVTSCRDCNRGKSSRSISAAVRERIDFE